MTDERDAKLCAQGDRQDNEIDYSDNAPLTKNFSQTAVHNPFYKPVKNATSVRIDTDVIAWLK